MAVIALAAVLSTGGGVTNLDPTSPEGTVQAYLDAALDGDFATAETYLSAEQQNCAGTAGFDPYYVPEDSRVVLRDVTVDGDQASVEVDVTEGGVGGYTHGEMYRLEEEGGRWVITRAPWPYYECGFLP